MKPATRVPVPIDADERAEIETAMKRHGIRAMADYMRFAALYVARKGCGNSFIPSAGGPAFMAKERGE